MSFGGMTGFYNIVSDSGFSHKMLHSNAYNIDYFAELAYVL